MVRSFLRLTPAFRSTIQSLNLLHIKSVVYDVAMCPVLVWDIVSRSGRIAAGQSHHFLPGEITSFGESFDCLQYSRYHTWIAPLFNSVKAASFVAAARFYPLVDLLLVKCISPSLKKILQVRIFIQFRNRGRPSSITDMIRANPFPWKSQNVLPINHCHIVKEIKSNPRVSKDLRTYIKASMYIGSITQRQSYMERRNIEDLETYLTLLCIEIRPGRCSLLSTLIFAYTKYSAIIMLL